MHTFRAYLLVHSCWSFAECLLNGLVLSTPLHPLGASWVSGPLRFFGDVGGLRFSIIATCLTASRASITFLFVLRYAALRPSGLLYRALAHPLSGATLLIFVLVVMMTSVLIPFNLSVWDPAEIRAVINDTNPSLADFLEDKVVFGFRSGPDSLLQVAILLSASITLCFVLVEVLCVVLSYRFLNRHVPRRNSDGAENRTYVLTRNFLHALIGEQVVVMMMSDVPNLAYTVCLVSQCAYADELFGLHDTLVCAQFVVTHVFMVIVLKPLREAVKQWTGFGITGGIPFFSFTSRGRVSAMR